MSATSAINAVAVITPTSGTVCQSVTSAISVASARHGRPDRRRPLRALSRDRVDNVLYCLLTCPRIGDTPALHRTRISNREGRMLRSVFAKAIVAASLVGVLFPATALAQSAITGLVKDSSGGVLPGVAVEASSPALIEKSRTVVSDAQGRYTVVDLRPGVYKVTFTIQGFGTFIQDRI